MEFQLKNVKIYYEVLGEGKPVVMVHGYFSDHQLMAGCMEPVFQERSGYKRIYIDLPGMGKSGSADWINSSDRMLDVLAALIRKVVPHENFLLAGESYGGYLSRGILYRMRERVDGLLLICPVVVPLSRNRDTPPHIVLVRDDQLLGGLSPEAAKYFDSAAVVQSPSVYERYAAEVVSGLKLADSPFLKHIKNSAYGFSFDVDEKEKAAFSKPVLFLTGRQDACVGYRDAWGILEHYPRATFAVLDLAGHNLQIEQAVLFNTLVKDWLTRTENFPHENGG